MADGKIVLAHCEKTGKKFCMEVRRNCGTDSVVNFVELTDAEYKALFSEISSEGLCSAQNLLPCRYCGSRKVAGCSCNRRRNQCRKKGEYDFQCLYCDSLSVDPPRSSKRKIYVTSACFDNIGEVLTAMGLQYSAFSGSFDCDILFINCGTSDRIDPRMLEAFVKNGGCLYASDLASSFIASAFPGMISYENEGVPCRLAADVVDTELLQITGRHIDIEFDLSGWSVLKKTQGRVLLKASGNSKYAGRPIMISFTYGKGVVFYTSFHNHTQASEKEKLLLQLLLAKQIGTSSDQSVEQVLAGMGINITVLKDKFRQR